MVSFNSRCVVVTFNQPFILLFGADLCPMTYPTYLPTHLPKESLVVLFATSGKPTVPVFTSSDEVSSGYWVT